MEVRIWSCQTRLTLGAVWLQEQLFLEHIGCTGKHRQLIKVGELLSIRMGNGYSCSKGSKSPHTRKHTHSHSTFNRISSIFYILFLYGLFYFFHLKTHRNHFPMLLDIFNNVVVSGFNSCTVWINRSLTNLFTVRYLGNFPKLFWYCTAIHVPYTYFVYISNDHSNFIIKLISSAKSFLQHIANFTAGHEILNKFLKNSFLKQFYFIIFFLFFFSHTAQHLNRFLNLTGPHV